MIRAWFHWRKAKLLRLIAVAAILGAGYTYFSVSRQPVAPTQVPQADKPQVDPRTAPRDSRQQSGGAEINPQFQKYRTSTTLERITTP
jgi:hypothetical protein